MWNPNKLTIKNFRSIVSEVLTFENNKTYLLQGVNNTDEGAESNGSGKSSFREALCYCLGLPIYASSLTDIINDYAEETEVCFETENLFNGNRLKVTRSTPIKGSTKLKIELNDINQSDNFSSVAEGDKLIIELLGVPKEDILNHFIISKEKFTSFFTSSDTDKKSLINRFSGANKIDGIEIYVNNDLKVLEQDKRKIEDEISKLNGKLALLGEDLLSDQQQDFEEKKSLIVRGFTAKIEEYKKSYESNKNTIDFNEVDLAKRKKESPDYEKEIQSFNLQINLHEKSINLLKQGNEEFESELLELKKIKNQIDNALAGLIKCPKCFHEWTSDTEIDIKEAKLMIPEITEMSDRFNSNIVKNNKEIADYQKEKRSFSDKITDYENKKGEHQRVIQKITRQIALLKEENEDCIKLVKSYESKILEAKAQVKVSRQKEINEKIKATEKEIKLLEVKVEDKNSEIFTLSQWIVRFQKFKSYLANKSLSNIQGLANIYLKNMGSNLGIKIEGYKQNKDGSIKEKITPIVLRDGIIEGSGSYKKYSGGERCRVDVAITLSMRHLINSASKTGGINLFWIDEITEGTDSVGLENIARSINNLGITSILTSHVKHEKNYNRIFTAIKDRGETWLLISN